MYAKITHAFAGTLILLSLLLTITTGNNNWLWIAAFVGANLLQNSITNWCLLHQILKRMKVKDSGATCG